MDSLHCTQKTGRTTYAIHQLDRLDTVPDLEDTTTQIQYINDVGQVTGKRGRGI